MSELQPNLLVVRLWLPRERMSDSALWKGLLYLKIVNDL